MKKNRVKERWILLGGTIGIGAISLAITLMVYNVQLSNESKQEIKEDSRIVYNDNLTEEQRRVAENLIAELDKLEIASSTSAVEEDEAGDKLKQSVDNTKNDGSNQNNMTTTNETNQIQNESNLENVEIVYNTKLKNSDDEQLVVETIAKANKKISFVKPVEGEIGMIFSDEKLVYSKTLNEWLTHKALDILAEEGTDVKASADGTVKDMYNDTRYGYTIAVEHADGYVTKYSGITENGSLKIGKTLKQGDIISQISAPCGFEISEGCHLHFEVLKDGVNIEPEFI